ncbi:probable G-protein coupled receptor 21 [Strongylocentrotus purpuratus]|uniref:G-protein coupled receptors family 1 profile domain-containing protein n=1 Tax=Strongylocentrotus purpuratus TaxID=7668 RepID=A0A7M7G0P1_STRPU|nr:probable G-protein coupled receptor 21 [Strongylocentrotus purpuratus]
MLILTLASGDRYVAVTRPLRYFTLASRKRMIGALTAVIIVPLFLSAGSYLQSVLTGVCNPFTSICLSLINPSHIIYNILPFTAVVITTFMNARLVCISRRHARQIAAQEAVVNAGNIALPLPSAAGTKGLKTILVVTGVFYLAWLPGTIITFLIPIPSINVPLVLIIFVRYAITSNSWWNACVYCIMNKSYRNVLFKMLRKYVGACIRPRDDVHENVPVYQLPYVPPM